jgi:cobalt/nickel transport system permease protein
VLPEPLSRLTARLRATDERALLVCMLAYVACAVLTPRGAWLTFAALAAVVDIASTSAAVPLRRVLGRLALVSPVLAMVALSALLEHPLSDADALRVWAFGHPLSHAAVVRAASIMLSAGLSVWAATVAAHLSGAERLAHALAGLGVPRLLVSIVSMTVRYLSVGEDEVRRMLRARDARGVPPRLRDRIRVAGAMVGSLFVRSLDRAERVGSAMAARGFDGTIPLLRTRPARWGDWVGAGLFVAVCVLVVALPGGPP